MFFSCHINVTYLIFRPHDRIFSIYINHSIVYYLSLSIFHLFYFKYFISRTLTVYNICTKISSNIDGLFKD